MVLTSQRTLDQTNRVFVPARKDQTRPADFGGKKGDGDEDAAAAAAAASSSSSASDGLARAKANAENAMVTVQVLSARLASSSVNEGGGIPDVAAPAAVDVSDDLSAADAKHSYNTRSKSSLVRRGTGCYSSLVKAASASGGSAFSPGGTCATPRAYEPFGEGATAAASGQQLSSATAEQQKKKEEGGGFFGIRFDGKK